MVEQKSRQPDRRVRQPTNESELRRVYVHLTEAQRLSRTGSFTLDFSMNETLLVRGTLPDIRVDPLNRHPARKGPAARLVRLPTLEHRKVEFPGFWSAPQPWSTGK